MLAPALSPAADNQDPLAACHRATVVCLSKLPPFHPTALKLLNISSEGVSAIADFEAVFRADPALTADLLLVANSAQFGSRSRVATIRHALAYLGLERVRALASTIAVCFFVRSVPRSEYIHRIWGHSVATAVIAEVLGRLGGRLGLYTAGLTHDLGRLGLFNAGPQHEPALSAAFAEIEEANALERSLYGMDHCEAGAVLAGRWNFPGMLRDSMLDHHRPPAGQLSDALALIHLACRMADSLGFPEVLWRESPRAPALPEHLRRHADLAPGRLRAHIAAQMEAIETSPAESR